MKGLKILWILAFFHLAASALHAAPASTWECPRAFENFETDTVGTFPTSYKSFDDGDLKKAIQNNVYTVAEENGNKFLRAVAQGSGVIIYREADGWDLSEYPALRWRWRVHKSPAKGDERYIRSNDAAAAVYVIWKSSVIMRVKSIKFTWSSTLDLGTHMSKRFGNDNLHVQNNFRAPLGEWIEETVDVRALYKKYFDKKDGEELEKPIAIAVLSDRDQTESAAEADYDDIALCRGVNASPQPASVAPATAPKR
ncbi:MAG TPA: DUF3047 domain-containing protein [Bdellovibrionota bacterium]|jgi:hypothetical protein|nr:DUF3047 domain-containing protein [Bdellovibrionota bacterium]